MEGEAVVGHIIAKSCVAARVRTNPSAHEMRLAPPGPRLLCHLHQASFLHRLVILLRDGEVLGLSDSLIHALRLVCRHQMPPLALFDSGMARLWDPWGLIWPWLLCQSFASHQTHDDVLDGRDDRNAF